jgi:hypothetical protein
VWIPSSDAVSSVRDTLSSQTLFSPHNSFVIPLPHQLEVFRKAMHKDKLRLFSAEVERERYALRLLLLMFRNHSFTRCTKLYFGRFQPFSVIRLFPYIYSTYFE